MEARTDLFMDGIIVVGVSGGPDSMSLLHILHSLGYTLAVGHLDHGLRPEAGADAEAVRTFAGNLDIPFFIKKVDTNQYAQDQGMSIEEAARDLRYRFLFEKAEEVGAQAVAVGHTADDQVETVLMHLLRGAGLAGLGGMRVLVVNPSWHDQIPVLRPLLGVWRENVLAYCEEHKLEPRFDQSNLDTTFYRNKLRHELIPTLADYNPKIKEVIFRMAETLAADHEVLEDVVDRAWAVCVVHLGDLVVGLDVDAFLSQPLAVQRVIVRRAVGHLLSDLRDIDFAAVERFINFAADPPKTGKTDLTAGLGLWMEEGLLWLAEHGVDLPTPDWPQLDEEINLAVPGEVNLSGGWVLRAASVSMDEQTRRQAVDNNDPNTAWLAVGDEELTLRTRKNGDRFQPLGMDGHSLKLSDFFINIKLSKRARAAWPLVCVGDQIAWVAGKRSAEPFRVREQSEHVVRVELSGKQKLD